MLALAVLRTLVQIQPLRITRVVVPMVRLAEIVKLLNVLAMKNTLQRVKVLGHTPYMRRLGDDTGAAGHAPLQEYLCRSALAFVGNLGDDGVVEKLGDVTGVVGGIAAGEGRVGCYVDVVLLVPFHPLGLLEIGVESTLSVSLTHK